MTAMTTVTEALSIVDSLYQSRETLLHHTFTPFASLAHSPHSLVQLTSPHSHGCTVSIGPHAFLNTHVYLCDWKPPGAQSQPPAAAPSPAPLSAAAITPTLVAALNAASQSDRKLAETLRKAATGEASADELAGLATFIEHLRRQEELAAASPPLPVAGGDGSGAPPSVVIDFAETRYSATGTAAASSSRASAVDRRVVLPAHFVLTPLPPRNQNPMRPALFHDVLLSLFVFPSELTPPQSARGRQRLRAAPDADFNAPVPVDIVVEGCDQRMLDGLWRAARNGRPRDDQLERWARQMINSVPHRTHILHIPPAVAAAAAAEAALANPDDPTSSAGMSRSASQTGPLAGVGGVGTPSNTLAGTKRGASARESPAAAAGLMSGTKRQRTSAGAAAASPAPSSGRPPPAKRGSRTSAVRAGSATASTPDASSPAAGPSRGLDGASSGILSLDQSPAPSSPAASAATSSTTRGGPAKKGKGKGKAKGKGKGKRRSIFAVGSEDDEDSEQEVVLTGGSRRRAAAAALD
ncbi:hypothetical protein JCM3774_000512 [Rhodotorula dairenensis]